jgi:5-amino-6-(5-phosphoribosylamino)uracil reductase
LSLPELRLVLAVSLDGRLAPAVGGAAQLGGRGDRQVLEEALAWADGCLIGARTLRLHGSTCVIRRPDLLDARATTHRGAQPVAVVVSRDGIFDPGLPFFAQRLQRWLLGGSGFPAPGFQRQLELTDWASALVSLKDLGLQRLVLLGGAELASRLLSEGLVSELQLTLCPRLLGGPHTWIPPQAAAKPGAWRLLEHRALGGEELLLRYRLSPDREAADPPESGSVGRSAGSDPATAHP